MGGVTTVVRGGREGKEWGGRTALSRGSRCRRYAAYSAHAADAAAAQRRSRPNCDTQAVERFTKS